MLATGLQAGLGSIGMVFDPNCPYTACKLCGAVYQSNLDRDPFNDGTELRKAWSIAHARRHSHWQHRQLAKSGRWCTPEAAFKLAAFGIIPITDLVMDEEVTHALAESSPVPTDDVEGT